MGAISIDQKDVQNVFLGDQKIYSIYVGENLIYKSYKYGAILLDADGKNFLDADGKQVYVG